MFPRKTSKIIQRAVLLASAAFLSWLILNSKWPAMPFLPSDVSFLLVPFLSFFIVLFVASVASTSVDDELWKGVVTKALRGLAFSVFIFQIYSWAPIPSFVQVTFLPLQVTWGVIVASTIAVEFPKIHRYREPLLTAVSATILALFSYYVGTIFSKENSSIINFVLPFVGGLLTVGFGAFMGFLKYTKLRRIQILAEWISHELVRNFLVGFLFVLYVFFFRPSVVGKVPSWIAVEWIFISSVVAVMYFNVTKLSKDLYADVGVERKWRKHVQKVKRETGRDFSELLHVQKLFVNENIKEPLLVYMTFYLHYLEQPDSILTALTSLVNYREVESPLAFLPWVKKRVERKNREARTNILEKILEGLEKAGNT